MTVEEAPEKLYIALSEFTEDGRTFVLGHRTDYPICTEYTRTDSFIKRAKEDFCKASCNGHPPRSTCTSLGTCEKYDNFVKFLRGE